MPATSPVMPVVFVPHGGGPLPLLDDPGHRELASFMQQLATALPQPEAILVISAHWEEAIAGISSAATPAMMYDYHGFPPESYQFTYSAPGNPALANQVLDLLHAQGIEARVDAVRGYDHGTFVPLMLMYPSATIPVVQLSLLDSLDPAAHVALGKAIAPLRERGVLILGSGMSFHNMRAFFSNDMSVTSKSEQFNDWLVDTLTGKVVSNEMLEQSIIAWQVAPEARFSHPREEHLLPLLVCLGAASKLSRFAETLFSGLLFNTHISGFIWR